MKKREKIAFILTCLDHYFPSPEIPLKHHDHYTLLIAVLLSARSTDAMVNRITPALFARASTPEEMMRVPVEEIRALIKPCGLSPQKSRAIKELSRLLVEKYGGRVPPTLEKLKELPGVGQKTASVLLCQAFHTPAFPVDTHIYRCARRWGLSRGKSPIQVEKDLKKSFPQKKWISLHLQIIYFARTFCSARGHRIEKCPICSILHQSG